MRSPASRRRCACSGMAVSDAPASVGKTVTCHGAASLSWRQASDQGEATRRCNVPSPPLPRVSGRTRRDSRSGDWGDKVRRRSIPSGMARSGGSASATRTTADGGDASASDRAPGARDRWRRPVAPRAYRRRRQREIADARHASIRRSRIQPPSSTASHNATDGQRSASGARSASSAPPRASAATAGSRSAHRAGTRVHARRGHAHARGASTRSKSDCTAASGVTPSSSSSGATCTRWRSTAGASDLMSSGTTYDAPVEQRRRLRQGEQGDRRARRGA